MREVIIHIGLHKTGSTAIQYALDGYRDDSIKYSRLTRQNHSNAIQSIFSKDAHSIRFYKNYGITKKEVGKEKIFFKAQLENELNDPFIQKLIISGENISNLKTDEKKEMLNFFKLHNWNCKILCFVRDPNEWIGSYANTKIKLGINPKNISFNLKEKLQPFVDNLELKNVNVFDYSYLVKNNINIVDFVAKFLNIKLKKQTKFVNKSMSLEATAVAFKLNSIPITLLGYPNRILVRQMIIRELILFFSLEKGFKKPNTLFFKGLAQKESVEENCTYLKNTFGIEYNFSANDYNDKNLSEYLDDSLNLIPEKLKEFFLRFHISFDSLISLEKNLINLFVLHIEKLGTLISNEERLLFNKKLSSCSSLPELPADFNVLDYLLLNPDVLRSNIDPVEHYLIDGKRENRQYNKEFKRSQTTNLNFDRSTLPDSRIKRIIKRLITKLKLILLKL
jgi:hypothetical protein